MKLFEEIKIKGKNIELIKEAINRVEEASSLVDYGGVKLKVSKEHLFKLIDELYPELADYRLSINHEALKLRIVGLKKDIE